MVAPSPVAEPDLRNTLTALCYRRCQRKHTADCLPPASWLLLTAHASRSSRKTMLFPET